MSYQERSIEQRVTIQLGLLNGLIQRAIAQQLKRNPSTISRELRRNSVTPGDFRAHLAQRTLRVRRQPSRPRRKLEPGSARFQLIELMLVTGCPPNELPAV